jgi:hypothetical protein
MGTGAAMVACRGRGAGGSISGGKGSVSCGGVVCVGECAKYIDGTWIWGDIGAEENDEGDRLRGEEDRKGDEF